MAFRRTRAESNLADAWQSCFLAKEDRGDAKRLVAALQGGQVDQRTFRKVLQFVVKAAEQGCLDDATATAIAADDGIAATFVALFDIVRTCVCAQVKAERVRDDLTAVKMPEAFVADIYAVLSKKREALMAAAAVDKIRLPSILAFRWRVDVTISTSSLSRVFKPQILMMLTLSDGRVRTFACSAEQFHAMRYGVAKLLKNAQNLGAHSVMTQEFKN